MIFFKNKLAYDIDEDLKILFQTFVGEISSDSIIKLNDQTISDPRFAWNYHWVIDVRQSKQLFAHNKLNSFFNFYLKNAGSFRDTKMAVIVGSPKQYMTVDTLKNMFESNHIQITVKMVLDKELACNWILQST